jgi:ABC-type phosphate transport system substrate-binding protein
MRCDFSMGNTSMKFIAGAVLLCLASAASAATIVGGGATLPAIGYTGVATGSPITPVAGSLFGVYTAGGGNAVTYCPTGSGAGKKILAGNDSANFLVTGTCGGTAPAGFGAASASQAYFAGSDAPLSATEYSAYTTGHGSQPVQLPAIAGAISVVFNKSGVSSMTLSEGQICGIFSGQITDWSDSALTGTVPAGTSGAIRVVYRSDNSGTSFSFLNHLSALCPTNVAAGKTAATQFKTTQGFAVTGQGASAYTSLYAAQFAASGNSGVTLAVSQVDGSIGYAETANGIVQPSRIASVKNSHSLVNVSPTTGFGPTVFPVTLTYNNVISDTLSSTGRPVLSPISGATGQCIAVVDPSNYADPSTGYPILAVTYLLGNTASNGADLIPIRNLLGSPYNTTTRTSVTKIGRINTGYAWLSNADLTQAKVNTCLN